MKINNGKFAVVAPLRGNWFGNKFYAVPKRRKFWLGLTCALRMSFSRSREATTCPLSIGACTIDICGVWTLIHSLGVGSSKFTDSRIRDPYAHASSGNTYCL